MPPSTPTRQPRRASEPGGDSRAIRSFRPPHSTRRSRRTRRALGEHGRVEVVSTVRVAHLEPGLYDLGDARIERSSTERVGEPRHAARCQTHHGGEHIGLRRGDATSRLRFPYSVPLRTSASPKRLRQLSPWDRGAGWIGPRSTTPPANGTDHTRPPTRSPPRHVDLGTGPRGAYAAARPANPAPTTITARQRRDRYSALMFQLGRLWIAFRYRRFHSGRRCAPHHRRNRRQQDPPNAPAQRHQRNQRGHHQRGARQRSQRKRIWCGTAARTARSGIRHVFQVPRMLARPPLAVLEIAPLAAFAANGDQRPAPNDRGRSVSPPTGVSAAEAPIPRAASACNPRPPSASPRPTARALAGRTAMALLRHDPRPVPGL